MSKTDSSLTKDVDSVQPKEQKQSKKSGGKSKKARNLKENGANNFANVFSKDSFSSNWKSFKQNILSLEKDNVQRTEKTKKWRFRKKKSSEVRNPTSISSAHQAKSVFTDLDNKEKTKIISIDCEMVGIDTGKDSMLARVSLVNKYGNCIYDKYVLPSEPVVDYRTHVSGIRPKDLHNGETFETVQKEVAEILKGRVLVGHALRNDLKVLFLGHPRRAIRDTSRYKPFRKLSNGGTPSLRKLAEELLGVKIQQGEHDSVVDARTAMQLYLLYKKEWEKGLHSRSNPPRTK